MRPVRQPQGVIIREERDYVRKFNQRGRRTSFFRRDRKTGTQANIIALPATTATAPVSGFQKMDAVATKGKTTIRAIKVGKTSAVTYSWEPEYLDRYDAVYPMDKNLLFRVLSVQTYSRKTRRMEQFILRWVAEQAKAGMEITCQRSGSGNIYVTKGFGPVYPTIVAHTDTVHDIVRNDEYQVRSNGKVMWAMNPKTGQETGIGGDDKVGIFVALSMLRDLPNAKAAFFVDEEVGCVGSSLAAMEFFADSAFVIQCDRKGNDDFVDRIMGTELYGEEFSEAIKSTLGRFDYSETVGGMTDVWQLKELGLDVAAMNMSCGYFSPHSRWETVGIPDVQRCYDVVQTLCENFGGVRWPHVAEEPAWKSWKSTTQPQDAGAVYYGPYATADDGSWLSEDETWGMRRTRTDSSNRYIWKDGALVRVYPEDMEDRTDRSLRAAVRQAYADMATTKSVSISQLLEEDRAIIESANMDWEGSKSTRRYPDYPECPECASNSLVIYDDTEETYHCYGCEFRFTTGHNPWTDDETRFWDAEDGAETVYAD